MNELHLVLFLTISINNVILVYFLGKYFYPLTCSFLIKIISLNGL